MIGLFCLYGDFTTSVHNNSHRIVFRNIVMPNCASQYFIDTPTGSLLPADCT
jgi:hypothetical protein